MDAIHVVLVEDHKLVRAGMRALLQSVPGVEVVGEAGDGQEALVQIARYQPDVVLMDIAMPGMNGLVAAMQVAQEYPAVRVVMLSMHANEEYVWQALRAGAVGYLLKDASTSELEIALRAVMEGATYLSPAISKRVVAYIERMGGETDSLERLTARQREVLRLVAEGCTTQEIAGRLNLSGKTVETHRAQIMERLGIYDMAGLIRYAIRKGLVTLDD